MYARVCALVVIVVVVIVFYSYYPSASLSLPKQGGLEGLLRLFKPP